MTRITNSGLAMLLLNDLDRTRSEVASLQAKLANGREIQRPSDDPYGAVRILQYDEAKRRTEQHLSNTTDARGYLAQADASLKGFLHLAERARELTIQGGGALGLQQREMIASEIDQLADQLKAEANTTWGGAYIFSGTNSLTPPYTTAGPDNYAGNNGVVRREISKNTKLDVSLTGVEVIGDNTTGLLRNLRDIATNLRADNVNAITSTDLSNMNASIDKLLSYSSIMGARMNRAEIASNRLEDMSLSITIARSEVADADMPKTILEYNTRSTALEAALAAASRIIQPTLLDYLR